ncbi:MAG: hypothetical protein ACI8P0_001293 [Planctomycetaceae bacterium]|jgi:hypothetical protein
MSDAVVLFRNRHGLVKGALLQSFASSDLPVTGVKKYPFVRLIRRSRVSSLSQPIATGVDCHLVIGEGFRRQAELLAGGCSPVEGVASDTTRIELDGSGEIVDCGFEQTLAHIAFLFHQGLPAFEYRSSLWGQPCGSSRDFICDAIVVAGSTQLPW